MKIYSVYENHVHELEVEIVFGQNLRAVDRLERLPAFRFDIAFVRGFTLKQKQKRLRLP